MSKPEDIKLCIETFFTHPHWSKCVDIIKTYIEPLKDATTIETKGKTADEVFAEVKGRQIAYETLNKFISESLTIQKTVSKKQPRKFQ